MESTNDCECVWTYTRGRTRLLCELRAHAGEVEIEVRRNSRLYGCYRFTERLAALDFAGRLRDLFAGNGWMTA